MGSSTRTNKRICTKMNEIKGGTFFFKMKLLSKQVICVKICYLKT